MTLESEMMLEFAKKVKFLVNIVPEAMEEINLEANPLQREERGRELYKDLFDVYVRLEHHVKCLRKNDILPYKCEMSAKQFSIFLDQVEVGIKKLKEYLVEFDST